MRIFIMCEKYYYYVNVMWLDEGDSLLVPHSLRSTADGPQGVTVRRRFVGLSDIRRVCRLAAATSVDRLCNRLCPNRWRLADTSCRFWEWETFLDMGNFSVIWIISRYLEEPTVLSCRHNNF